MSGTCKFQNQTGRTPNGIYDSNGNNAPGTQPVVYFDKKAKKWRSYWDFDNANVQCDTCGDYHISTGDNSTSCYKFMKDINSPNCLAQALAPLETTCTPLPSPPPAVPPQGSKSTFGKKRKNDSINPVVIILVIAAIAILLYFLLSNKKFKKSLFGKRK